MFYSHSDTKAEFVTLKTINALLFISTESKLNRLEGGNKRNIKSKDILSALTEARDDHLYQSSLDTQPATLSVTEDTAATNDPWSSTNTSQCYLIQLFCSSDLIGIGTLHAIDSRRHCCMVNSKLVKLHIR